MDPDEGPLCCPSESLSLMLYHATGMADSPANRNMDIDVKCIQMPKPNEIRG